MGFSNNIIGTREQLAVNSNKYGYSLKGACVRRADGKGYNSFDGSPVDTAVTSDASVIVKEQMWLSDVAVGDNIVLETVATKVLGITRVDADCLTLDTLNLETGEQNVKRYDVRGKIVAKLWDTFKNPEKKLGAAEIGIGFNEFTPAQLFDIASGKTTVEALRAPKPAENNFESLVKQIVLAAIDTATSPTVSA